MSETANLKPHKRDPVKTERESSIHTTVIDQDTDQETTRESQRSFSQELSFSSVKAQARMTYWKKRKEFIEKYKQTAQSDINLIDACAARAIANVIDRFDDSEANVKTAVYQQLKFEEEEVELEEPVKEYGPDRNNDLMYELHLVQSEIADAQLLTDLAGSRHLEVKEIISEHSKCPIGVLMYFASGDSVDLRYAMAENHNLPVSVLEYLTEDDNPYVSMRAEKTLARILCCA